MTVTRPALGKLYPLAKGLRGNQRRDAKKHWVSSGHSGDPADVRFTPESRRMQRTSLCPLWAKSGHGGRQCYSRVDLILTLKEAKKKRSIAKSNSRSS